MSEIDRRTLLGAAGAGLALAGLGGQAEAKTRRRGMGMGMGLSPVPGAGDAGGHTLGPCQLWGESARTVKTSSADLNFDPRYVCAVYIRYEKNGRPSIRHAYKPLPPPKTDDVIRDTAEDILKDLRDDDYHSDIVHVRRNFRQFTMNSQQVIVLFLDNDPAIIRFNDDPELENLIRFTAFSGVPPYTGRRENHAFHNLRRIKMTKGEFDCNNAYRVDFWNTDETGAPLEIDSNTAEEDRYIYSMNIHLLQAPYEPDEVAAIPLILDPDTGNMGAEP
jgi:hypothetical protein